MLTAEIDLGAIKDNAFYIKKRVKTEVYAVVKADAYGRYGSQNISKTSLTDWRSQPILRRWNLLTQI